MSLRHWVILCLLMAAEVVAGFESSMVLAALPSWLRIYGDPIGPGWTVSAYLLVASASAALETGLLLRADDPAAVEVRIALRPGVFAPGLNLESRLGGRQRIYLPAGIGERGEDYEIGRFREMVRDE